LRGGEGESVDFESESVGNIRIGIGCGGEVWIDLNFHLFHLSLIAFFVNIARRYDIFCQD
jgi:hypothetical protein